MPTAVEELQEHIDVLASFEREYRKYVATQMALDAGQTGPLRQDQLPERRAKLVRRVSRASRAMGEAGVRLQLSPPPMFAGPVLTDFAGQVLAHETHTYGSGPDPFAAPRMILDALGTALGSLEDDLQQEQRKEAEKQERKASRRAPSTGEVVTQAKHQLPTLWGRIRALPGWIGLAADVVTVVSAFGVVAKVAGLW